MVVLYVQQPVTLHGVLLLNQTLQALTKGYCPIQLDQMDMRFLMKQAQQMQRKMEEMKKELAKKEIKVSSGGGMIEITINGQQQINEIKIEPDVIDINEKEMLEDLILAAVNEALRQSKELAAQEMGKLTGGANIPGLF